ncbi:MAG TPA: hypothetical protein V6C91_00225 [Coleofasciculaceae cyanobacterium]
MATRRTHSYTRRIKQLKVKKQQQQVLTPEEIAELARLIQQYGDV